MKEKYVHAELLTEERFPLPVFASDGLVNLHKENLVTVSEKDSTHNVLQTVNSEKDPMHNTLQAVNIFAIEKGVFIRNFCC